MDITIFTIPQYPPNFIPIGSVFAHRVNLVKAAQKGVFNYVGTPVVSSGVNDLEKQIEQVRIELLKKLKEEARKKDPNASALVNVKVIFSVIGESSILGQASATVLIKKSSGLNSQIGRQNSQIGRQNSQIGRQNSPVAPLVQVPRPNSQIAPLGSPALVAPGPGPGPGPLGSPGSPALVPRGSPPPQQGGRKKYVSKLGKSRKNRI